jgi:hypothetical protein
MNTYEFRVVDTSLFTVTSPDGVTVEIKISDNLREHQAAVRHTPGSAYCGVYRLKVRRAFMPRPGFVVGTYDELQRLAALPDCEVIPDPYNPPGFAGAAGVTP